MSYQPGFFDVQERMEKIQQYKSPLLKLGDYIDFDFFRKELEHFFTKGKDYSKGGRPAYDYVELRSQVSGKALTCIQDFDHSAFL